MRRFCLGAVLAALVLMAARVRTSSGQASEQASGQAGAEKGKAVFERCAACHSLEPGKNDEAPTLAGIFGRKAAGEDYRYSAAMKQSGVTWDEKSLASFIEDPQAFVPGNRMAFDGVKDKQERDDLLAYLKAATKKAESGQMRAAPGIAWGVAQLLVVQ